MQVKIDTRELRNAFSKSPTGVTIVTTVESDGTSRGFTALEGMVFYSFNDIPWENLIMSRLIQCCSVMWMKLDTASLPSTWVMISKGKFVHLNENL